MSDPLLTLVERLTMDAAAAREIPSLIEWSSRIDVSLQRCPSCGGQPLTDTATRLVRCGCGWSGVAVRRLP